MACYDLSKSYGISNYPECSGHGSCINGLCVCDIGWVGQTDMEFITGRDCDINTLSVTIWSVINLILATTALMLLIYCSVKENILAEKNRYRSKTICIGFFTLLNVSGCIFYSLRVYDVQGSLIGRHVFISVIVVLMVFFVACAVASYFIILVKFLKSYSKFFDSITRGHINDSMSTFVAISRGVPVFVLVTQSVSVFPVLTLPEKYSDEFNIALCVSFLIAYCVYAFSVLYVLRIFLREVKHYISDKLHEENAPKQDNLLTPPVQAKPPSVIVPGQSNDIVNIYNRISLAEFIIRPFLISGIPLNIAFASWYYLRRKTIYLLMFEFTMASLMSMGIVWSLTSSRGKIGPIIGSSTSVRILVKRVSAQGASAVSRATSTDGEAKV